MFLLLPPISSRPLPARQFRGKKMKINRKTNQCFVLSAASCVFTSRALLPRGKQIPICSSVLFLHRAGQRWDAAVCVSVSVWEVHTSDIVTPDSLISIDYFTAAFLVEKAKRRESPVFQTHHERERTRNEGNKDTHREGGTFGLLLDFLGKLWTRFSSMNS